MTNAMIIFVAQQQLLSEGKIQPTGRILKGLNGAGEEISYPEAEVIHTYAHWRELGYQVQKGQKAVASLTIWKHAGKVNEETGEEENARMFMKTAAFFAAHQVEAMQASAAV